MKTYETLFDYWCPEDDNYVLLERNEYDTNMLNGQCTLCGLDIVMTYEDFKKWEKEYWKKEV